MPEGNDTRWWHALVFTAAASAGTFIASHWGGVTHDDLAEQMRKAKAEIIEEVGKKLDSANMAHAKDVDDLRQYIDAKTTPAAPKKKRKTEERRGE